MNLARLQNRSTFRLIAGWWALLLYAGACAPLGLGVAALGGLFDRSHQLSVRGGGQGLQLVLQHGRDCTGHQHGAVARALTIFAQPASATDPDHILHFSAPDSFLRQAQLSAPAPAAAAQPDFAVHEISLASPREVFLSFSPTHPPPGHDGQLVCLRSTLLLI